MTMMRGWQIILPLALAIAQFVAAKPTTQETLVVSRAEEEGTTASPAPSTELTSEEPNPPVKLTEMDVQSRISLRYAHTAVVTHVRNPARRAQETTFRMILPDTAFISGFTMTIDGKAYKAYVKEKQEAKQIYSEAVSHGFGAAHIASKARDSNHFTVSVNIEPRSTVIFNLTYEELLVRRNGVYNHDINLHPGALVPKMKVTVHIKETAKIAVLRVPEIRTGNEVDAMENDPQNTKAVIKREHDDREATITFTPDLEEQRRLMQVYMEKSKESYAHVNRYYPDDDEAMKEKAGVLGQFVVQYDVDRPEGGEVLVNDGYFVHFFAPKSLPPLPKHVVFVLDTSGSMMGRKVEQLRDAMQTILGKMNQHDYFSIVEFNSYVKVLDLSKADVTETSTWRYQYFDNRPSETKLVPPSRATPGNIANAKIIISRLDAGGGTNIGEALDVAINLIQKGVEWESNEDKKENQTASKSEDDKNKTTEVANTTTDLDLEKENKLEPMIIFLTDGDPTVGETNPTRIISRVTEKNSIKKKAIIFSLAFGEDADRKFLRELSLRNDGFMRHIYEAADAALQLQDFYRSVSSPLLTDVKFLYPKAQIKQLTKTKDQFRTFYAGSETVVAGQLDGDGTALEPQVLAFCGVQNGGGRKRYEVTPKVTVVRNENYLPLERLWAYLSIKQLLDEKEVVEEANSEERKKELDKKALAIALKYELVTPLTSLVVVKPNDTKAVDAESVDDNRANDYDFDSGSRIIGGFSGFQASRPLFLSAGINSFPDSGNGVSAFYSTPQPSLFHYRSGINSFPDSGNGVSAFYSTPQLSLFHYRSGINSFPDSGNGVSAFYSTPQPSLFHYRSGINSFPDSGNGVSAFYSTPQPSLFHYRSGINSFPDSGNGVSAFYSTPQLSLFHYRSGINSFPDSGNGVSAFYSTPQPSLFHYRSALPAAQYMPGLPSLPGAPPAYSLAPGYGAYGVLPMAAPAYASINRYPVSVQDALFSSVAAEMEEDDDTLLASTTEDVKVEVTAQPPSTTPRADPLAPYSLAEFPWTLPLLDAATDSLILHVNGTQVNLKLAKDVDTVPTTAGAACNNARGEEGAGSCVYLTRCAAARSLTAALYETAYCIYDSGFAGVCCSEHAR